MKLTLKQRLTNLCRRLRGRPPAYILIQFPIGEEVRFDFHGQQHFQQEEAEKSEERPDP